MRVRDVQAGFLYNHILADVRSRKHRVLILPSLSIDSICGTKILTTLFRLDQIPYQIVPVNNYTEVSEAVDEFLQYAFDSPISVILIDCGAAVDVTSLLRMNDEGRDQIVVNIFDSHRPLNLVNIRDDNRRVRVLLDMNDDIDSIMEQLGEEVEEEDEDDEGDDEDEDEDVEGDEDEERDEDEEEILLEQENKDEDEDNDDDEDDEREEQDTESERKESGRKRKTGVLTVRRSKKAKTSVVVAEPNYLAEDTKRRRAEARLERVNAYYRVQSYALPIAYSLYLLAGMLDKNVTRLEWLAILGTTERLILERIDSNTYSHIYNALSGAIAVDNNSQKSELSALSQVQKADLNQLITPTRRGQITPNKEYKFNLLRHWNLFESMSHSRHVAVALRIWTDKGESQLKTALAKMSIPLKEAMSPYNLMSSALKTTFASNLEPFGGMMGLVNNTYDSFFYQHNSAFITSAADVVLALIAIMSDSDEAPTEAVVQETDHSAAVATGVATSKAKFWAAFDCISDPTVTTMKRGLLLAIDTLKAVVRQSVAMFKKREVDTRNVIHFAVISSSPDIAYFTKPDVLAQLAFFLLDLIALKKVSRPLVVAVLLERADMYLVIGVNANKHGSTRQAASVFGAAFRATATRVHAQIRHDSFDTSAMLVAKDDWPRFMEQLVLIVSSQQDLRR